MDLKKIIKRERESWGGTQCGENGVGAEGQETLGKESWKGKTDRRRNRSFSVLIMVCSLALDGFPGTPLCKF